MVFPILKLKPKSLIEFRSVSSWVFLIKSPTIEWCGISENDYPKRVRINRDEKNFKDNLIKKD